MPILKLLNKLRLLSQNITGNSADNRHSPTQEEIAASAQEARKNLENQKTPAQQ